MDKLEKAGTRRSWSKRGNQNYPPDPQIRPQRTFLAASSSLWPDLSVWSTPTLLQQIGLKLKAFMFYVEYLVAGGG